MEGGYLSWWANLASGGILPYPPSKENPDTWCSYWAKVFRFPIESWPEWNLNPQPCAYHVLVVTLELSGKCFPKNVASPQAAVFENFVPPSIHTHTHVCVCMSGLCMYVCVCIQQCHSRWQTQDYMRLKLKNH